MAKTSEATWIWYPGDFEVWLGNIFNNRRTERGAMFPPFWKQDSHWPTVEFSKAFALDRPETVTIVAEGRFNLMLDGKLLSVAQGALRRDPAAAGRFLFTVPAGDHKLNLKVWNQVSPPALFVDGPTVKTGSTWLATYEDKIWIDENGVAHGSGLYVAAASWHFNSPDYPPSRYHLERKEQHPVAATRLSAVATLYDFGRETFGYLRLQGLKGAARIYYGESAEEAQDKEHCETLDLLHEGETPDSKAFRYVMIETEEGTSYDGVTMDYEYAPYDDSRCGSFSCSDDELNRIWQVAAYTMDLTTREFFMDGIKRDRWTWSGDAIQSYLMNYYLRFDTECVKRTIRQLRGKDPVTAHVNTIMDYTFYWFKSIQDYYDYTGDLDFVGELWPRMVTLMDYVLARTNADGLAEGQPDDWIFVDWVDFPMHKRGTLCFEQILFHRALCVMAQCAELLGCAPAALNHDYRRLADQLQRRIDAIFWNDDHHAYLHAVEDGQLNRQITKFPNMFAILYGIAGEAQQRAIMQHVMQNPATPAITTPYMRFYELETLCMAGLQPAVLAEMKAYWGGMLREGATSFWEKYNPDEHGAQHLAMYGRPYGKSLCHAWGASPIYIIGRYFLGVRPTKPGYAEYEVCPVLGGLDWMEGDVPTPFGKVSVKVAGGEVSVHSDGGHGQLIVGGRRIDIPAGETVVVTNRKTNE